MNTNKLLASLAGIAALLLTCGRVHAQADIPQPVTFTATILVNSTNYSTDGTNYSQGLPTTMRMTSKDVINLLTNYYATPVPSTARLVRVYGSYFDIEDSAGNSLLYDGDGVVYLDTSEYPVWTAKGANDYSVAGTETDYGVATLSIYTGPTMDIALTGYAVNSIKTAAATASGVKVSQSFSMKTSTGVAVIGNGDPSGNAVVTGSFSSKGTGMY